MRGRVWDGGVAVEGCERAGGEFGTDGGGESRCAASLGRAEPGDRGRVA